MSRIPSASQKSWLFGCGLALTLVFPINNARSAEIVLHAFAGGNDGAHPQAGLLADAKGNLYGTTLHGGTADAGTIFKIGRRGSETVLYTFTGGADGAFPRSTLISDANGNLYGTTIAGGEHSSGAVFKLSLDNVQSVLYSFEPYSHGTNPQAGLLLDGKGNLYGTTENGGDFNCDVDFGCGVVFKLAPDNTETILHTFEWGNDGAYPITNLVSDKSGNLYGTTTWGGDANCGPNGCGIVFRIGADGNYRVLHAFKGESDGAVPQAGVIIDAKGNLYGTTSQGGVANAGTVFRISPGGKERTLLAFDGAAGGVGPYAPLMVDERGNLYGTTSAGGASNAGTVFKLSPRGRFTVLYSFTGDSDGANPYAELIMDANGNLYGTTEFGGANRNGTVFKIVRKLASRQSKVARHRY
jgi:uncharacterized repeat protein (TIGR03803 family)